MNPANVIDLVGLRFGKLTVIEPSAEKHKSGTKLYLCRCDCGEMTISRSDYLRQGRKRSCGCMNVVAILDDLSGKRFGSLTVISRAPNRKSGLSARWSCRCDCGNTVIAYGGHLKTGAKSSCGCKTMTGSKGRRNVYESVYGILPDNYAVTTLDDNRRSYEPSNLYAIDRAALKIYHDKRRFWGHITDPSVKLLAFKTAELELALRMAESKLQSL